MYNILATVSPITLTRSTLNITHQTFPVDTHIGGFGPALCAINDALCQLVVCHAGRHLTEQLAPVTVRNCTYTRSSSSRDIMIRNIMF